MYQQSEGPESEYVDEAEQEDVDELHSEEDEAAVRTPPILRDRISDSRVPRVSIF